MLLCFVLLKEKVHECKFSMSAVVIWVVVKVLDGCLVLVALQLVPGVPHL